MTKKIFIHKTDRMADGTAELTAAQRCPNEIWKQIADLLDLQHCRSLRLVGNKTLLQAVNDSLKARLTLLYLHPTKTSMKNILEIIDSSLYPNITELCLLGDPMWPQIMKEFPGYRTTVIYPDYDIPGVTQDWRHLEAGVRYKPWPWRYEEGLERKKIKATGSRNDSSARPKKLNQNGNDSETCYRPLIQALLKLKKLRTLSYRSSPDPHVAGLNAVSVEQIRSHAHAVATRPSVKAAGRTRAPKIGPRSDADVFYHLLAVLKGTFGDVGDGADGIVKVDLRSELPLHETVAAQMRLDWPEDCFACLKDIDISIDCGWGLTESVRMYRCIIYSARNSVKSIRVRLLPNPVAWQGTNPRTEAVDRLFRWESAAQSGEIEMPNLRRLEILFVDSPGVDTISRHRSGRWRRPPILTFRKSFWERYLKTLTTVRFQHVVTWDRERICPVKGQHGIPATIEDDLTFLLDFPHKLEHFEWTVPLFWHDPRCKASDDGDDLDTRSCERNLCGVYLPTNDLPSTFKEMELTADHLGVDFDGDAEVWDFGQFIMERIRMREEGESECTTSELE